MPRAVIKYTGLSGGANAVAQLATFCTSAVGRTCSAVPFQHTRFPAFKELLSAT